MCEDIFMYEGELFGYGVGIDAPREVAMRTCARTLNPNGAMAMTKSKAKILLTFCPPCVYVFKIGFNIQTYPK